MKLSDARGSSTAEFAVLLPAVALMLSLLLCFGVLGMHQIQVQQAASAMAREMARGESDSAVRSAGINLAGSDAQFLISGGSGLSRVQVNKSVQLPLIGPVRVHGEASVANE